MQETADFFYQLEWPAPGARLVGPVAWLRGWVVGKSGGTFTDVRVACATGIHLGILGLPRTDLAAHFKSPQSWLPAEFVIGVPLPDGPAELSVEAMDEYGNWHRLQSLALMIASDGAASPRVEGEVIAHEGGSSTTRVPHHPFHGHLDEPARQPQVRDGRVGVFGWLLHEQQVVEAVFATINGLVYNALESGLTDASLATKVPEHAAARHARVRGDIDAPTTITNPGCLRVYAKLADDSVQLCFARRLAVRPEDLGPTKPATAIPDETGTPLPELPSGRPRRLLLVARSLHPDDATMRALDVAHHLAARGRWVARLVAAEDGPLRGDFEAAGCPVQIVDPRDYFAATDGGDVETALRALGRQISWRHLNAVAIFGPLSAWAGTLAKRAGIPVFVDPADQLTWFAPTLPFAHDRAADLIAPIRGQPEQGANVLLHVAHDLASRHRAVLAGRRLLVTDVRDTRDEAIFRASLNLNAGPVLAIAQQPLTAAAVVCPVFAGHPHRILLSALAAGVPVITTPSPLLVATFGANEMQFVGPGNPLALVHAIVDTVANPTASDRRVEAARHAVFAAHAPETQLPRWERLLEQAASPEISTLLSDAPTPCE